MTSREFADDGDAHCYSFEATARELVTITTNVDTTSSTKLLDTDGETELATRYNWALPPTPAPTSFEGPPTQITSRLEYILPETGTFFVSVTDAADISLGEFSLQITVTESDIPEPEDDHGSTADSATAVSLPASIAASMETSTDFDFFSFDVEPHELYFLQAAKDGDFGFWLRRHAADGEVLESMYLQSYRENLIVHRVGSADGVTLWSVSGSVGDFSLTADVVSYIDDHSNAVDAGTLITVPSSTAGSVETTGDLDHFSFEAVAGEEYSIFTEAEEETSDKTIRVIGYETVQETGFHGTNQTWTAPTDGEFTIEVSGSTSDYLLRVEVTNDDHGDTPDSATQLLPTDSTTAQLFSGDVDYFQFEATAGEVYRLDTSAAAWHEYTVSLYDTTGRQHRLVPSEDGRVRIDWVAQFSGTHTLELSDPLRGAGRGNVGLELRVIDYNDDYANLPENATLVGATSSTAGTLERRGDVDLFTFEATEQTLYEIRVESGGNLRAIVYREDEWPQQAAGPSYDGFWVAPASGRYLLAVGSATLLESPAGLYELNVTEVIYDDDYPGETATPISVPSEIFGEIEVKGDSDSFSFDVVEGNLYSIVVTELNPERTGPFPWSVIDSSGNPRLGNRGLWVATSSETFTVEFSARKTSEYSLTVSSQPNVDFHGDSFETATEIGIPSTADGTSNSVHDLDFFKFTVEGGARYLFSNVDGEVDVYDPSGTFLFTNYYWDYDIPAWRSTFEWTPPENGTYFVRSGPRTYGSFPTRHGFRIDVAEVTGDINRDGRVDSGDLGLLLNDFGDPPSETWPTDLNGDSLIDSADLGLLLNNFESQAVQATSSMVAVETQRMDVNRDGQVSKLDAQMIINRLHADPKTLDPQFDLNIDNRVTPLDALMVINQLNQSPDSAQLRTFFSLNDDDEKDHNSLADRVFAIDWKRA